MYKKAILPTAMKYDLLGSDIVNLKYGFNHWLNVLEKFGKLDGSNLTDDFNTILWMLKNTNYNKTMRHPVKIL